MITVLFPPMAFIYLFSALPLFLSRHRNDLTFTSDVEFVTKKDTNRTLLMVRWFNDNNPAAPANPRAFLQGLRQKYDRIVYFDDGDSTSSDLLDLLPDLDLMLRKQVYRDRNLYLKPQRGNRVFAEYALDHLGAQPEEETPYPVAAADQLNKIRTAWHLGIGLYPSRHWKELAVERAFPLVGGAAVRGLFHLPRRATTEKKVPICQARFAAKGYTPAIGHQRAWFQDKIAGVPRFASGFIDKKAYLAEMKTVAAVLSPFGWGEVCYRDFEAFLLGAVLVKPSMDHLETWPESYQPWKTYAPVRWDGSDLLEVVNRVLDDPGLARGLVEEGFAQWRLAFDQLDDRVETVLQWCLGGKP